MKYRYKGIECPQGVWKRGRLNTAHRLYVIICYMRSFVDINDVFALYTLPIPTARLHVALHVRIIEGPLQQESQTRKGVRSVGESRIR